MSSMAKVVCVKGRPPRRRPVGLDVAVSSVEFMRILMVTKGLEMKFKRFDIIFGLRPLPCDTLEIFPKSVVERAEHATVVKSQHVLQGMVWIQYHLLQTQGPLS
jgi:hypothetical protein